MHEFQGLLDKLLEIYSRTGDSDVGDCVGLLSGKMLSKEVKELTLIISADGTITAEGIPPSYVPDLLSNFKPDSLLNKMVTLEWGEGKFRTIIDSPFTLNIVNVKEGEMKDALRVKS